MKTSHKALSLGLLLFIPLTGAYAFSFGKGGIINEEQKQKWESQKTAIEETFKNNDYESWSKLMTEYGKTKKLEYITKENFPKFAQMKILMKEAQDKIKKAHKIGEELGIKKEGFHKKSHEKFMKMQHTEKTE